MTDRIELLEAMLDSLPDAAFLLDAHSHVLLWNQAAQAVTGYTSADLVGRPLPPELSALLDGREPGANAVAEAVHEGNRGFMVHAPHRLGHPISAIARHLVLRDGMGHRIGSAVLFHPAESLDALPHGESGESETIEASQEDIKERLESLCEDYAQGGPPFGVLWVTVDQAHDLRRTHGISAHEAMFKKVDHALAQGLRPAEPMGRWGEDEFLIVSHERTPAMLAGHAQVLAGLARTADFRWWGDRISLTVSIGAAQAKSCEPLAQLLERARNAMHSSQHAGGNHITCAPEGDSCSPS
jgi:diguanylate cyclase (GGDEF)-like protein